MLKSMHCKKENIQNIAEINAPYGGG